MSEEQVRTLLNLLSRANWNLNFYEFCSILGIRAVETDIYANEKWQAWQQLNRNLNQLSAEMIYQIVNSQTIERQ